MSSNVVQQKQKHVEVLGAEGQGGRNLVLEAAEVMVDEFKVAGETAGYGTARYSEQLYEKYKDVVKKDVVNKPEVYDTYCMHAHHC